MLRFRSAAAPASWLAARGPALGAALLLASVTSIQAQGRSEELARFVEVVGGAWAKGDVGPIVAHSALQGLMLELDEEAVGPLTSRQAAAELRRLFERRSTVAMRVGMASVIGGEPARAFGEITWSFRVEGTTIPETRTVFLALVEEEGAWRLTQIRVLR